MFGFGRPQSRGGYGGLFGPDVYGDTYSRRSGLTPRQELEIRRRQQAEMAQRRQLAQEEQAARRRRQQQQQHARAQALRRYNRAATVIQRAVRKHLAQRSAEEQDDAALVITDTIRRVAQRHGARRLVASLRALHSTRHSVRQARAAFEASPRGFRNLLGFVDGLERLTLALDAVSTHQDPFVRAFRKAVVREAQEGLRFADVVCNTMGRRATAIQQAVRQHQQAQHSIDRNAAARVITRAVRTLPVVRKARDEADVISQLHRKRRRLAQLQREYTEQLETIRRELGGLAATTDTGLRLRRAVRKEAKAALKAVRKEANGQGKVQEV